MHVLVDDRVRPVCFEHLPTERIEFGECYRLVSSAFHTERHGTDATEEIEVSHQTRHTRMSIAHNARLAGNACSSPTKKLK